MPDKQTKRKTLKNILSSPDFEHSRKHKKLLTYLVDCSVKGETPTENTIAIDVFDKNADFNPNEDTTVRVNVYHLRKKLEKYYLNEGRNDIVRMTIPVGHYELKFINYTKSKRFTRKHIIGITSTLSVLAILFLLFTTIYYYNQKSSAPGKNQSLSGEDDQISDLVKFSFISSANTVQFG